MATTAIAPSVLAFSVPSADILDADGTVATTPADGWVIALGAKGHRGQLICKLLADASGDTVTFLAGDAVALQAARGNLAVVLAASDVRYIVLESGRFEQDDNSIRATATDAGTSMRCFLMPPTSDGGTALA